MKFKRLIITSTLVFLFFGCENNQKNQAPKEQNTTQQSQEKQIKEDNKKSDISLKKDENKTIALNLIGGQTLQMQIKNNKLEIKDNNKATMLVFFATWCPPCRAEIPHLNNLSDKFKKDLNIIGILLEDKDIESIEKFIHKYKIKYDISYGEGSYMVEKAVGGVIGLPFSILYKSNGDHAITYTGLVPEEMLENDIKRAIK